MVRDKTGPGIIAQWSHVNQAWVIRPHNPEWQEEVFLRAPVLGIVSETEIGQFMDDWENDRASAFSRL